MEFILQTNDNSQLSKLVDQLSQNVEDLEMKLERTKTEEVDTSRLLAAMQSDKVAAARALTQNKQLKEQLEELQSGFIIMVGLCFCRIVFYDITNNILIYWIKIVIHQMTYTEMLCPVEFNY